MHNYRQIGSTLLLAGGLFSAPASGEVETFVSPFVPSLPFSGATRAGDMIFVGGTLGYEPDGRSLVSGGISKEADAAFKNVIGMVNRAGGKRSDIAKCVVLLSDITHFSEMNKSFAKHFPTSPPTRSTIVVAAIPRNATIEVECTAIVQNTKTSKRYIHEESTH